MKTLGDRLEDVLLAVLLEKGHLSTSALLDEVRSLHPCTRQGFYRALRKLRDEERVFAHHSVVSINEHWLRQVRALFTGELVEQSAVGDPTKLTHGEKLVYTLKGLSNMDRLWAHLFSFIEQSVPARSPLFLYNPHNWSAVLRPDVDRTHEDVLRKQGRSAFLIVGSTDILDKKATEATGFTHVETFLSKQLRSDRYVASIGEYFIQVRLSPKTRRAIQEVFQVSTTLENGRIRLKKLDRDASCTITIEKSPEEAKRWAKRIGTYFLVRS